MAQNLTQLTTARITHSEFASTRHNMDRDSGLYSTLHFDRHWWRSDTGTGGAVTGTGGAVCKGATPSVEQ